MHIETFDSPEEMAAALAAHREHAMASLAPAQAALTWDSYWVRWIDLDTKPPIVEFGHVFTAQQVADLDPVDDGLVEEVGREQDRGFLYGMAYSLLGREGEIGTTHKAHAWPIEGRLFEWAEAVGWDVTQLDGAGRFLLDLAFQSHRLHWLGLQEQAAQEQAVEG